MNCNPRLRFALLRDCRATFYSSRPGEYKSLTMLLSLLLLVAAVTAANITNAAAAAV